MSMRCRTGFEIFTDKWIDRCMITQRAGVLNGTHPQSGVTDGRARKTLELRFYGFGEFFGGDGAGDSFELFAVAGD